MNEQFCCFVQGAFPNSTGTDNCSNSGFITCPGEGMGLANG